jgi:hypothetical protein
MAGVDLRTVKSLWAIKHRNDGALFASCRPEAYSRRRGASRSSCQLSGKYK